MSTMAMTLPIYKEKCLFSDKILKLTDTLKLFNLNFNLKIFNIHLHRRHDARFTFTVDFFLRLIFFYHQPEWIHS